MSFQTDDLISAAFLVSRGHQPSRTERTGNFVTFVFESITEGEAAGLLAGPEHSLCKRYTHAWRSLRKVIEECQRNGARR